MQYSFVKACLLALAASTSVLAQTDGFNVITAPTSGETIKAGSTYTIKWTASDPAAAISLVLLQGSSNTTLQVADGFIAKSILSSEGKYDWAVPAESGSFASYGIKLQLDSDPAVFQYSNPFKIEGSGGAATKTVQLSQISTESSTSTSASLSSSSSSSSSVITTSSAPVSTTVAPSSSSVITSAPLASSTLSTAVVAPSTTDTEPTPAATSSATVPTNGASSNAAIGGSGLLGLVAVAFALL